MKMIEQYHEIESNIDRASILRDIESAGRTCYKSESAITETSASQFVQSIMKRGHLSVIEHVNLRVRFVTDRGVTHELVRHRLASYSQESTRYCNYGGDDIVFIQPVWAPRDEDGFTDCARDNPVLIWQEAMVTAENCYHELLREGWKPEQARSVLPNSLKTEIVMTCNLREWRTVLSLRTSPKAHPQMRALMLPLLAELKKIIPEIFGDI